MIIHPETHRVRGPPLVTCSPPLPFLTPSCRAQNHHINELMKMINIIALDEDDPSGRTKFTDKMKRAEHDRKTHKQEEQKKERRNFANSHARGSEERPQRPRDKL